MTARHSLAELVWRSHFAISGDKLYKSRVDFGHVSTGNYFDYRDLAFDWFVARIAVYIMIAIYFLAHCALSNTEMQPDIMWCDR